MEKNKNPSRQTIIKCCKMTMRSLSMSMDLKKIGRVLFANANKFVN